MLDFFYIIGNDSTESESKVYSTNGNQIPVLFCTFHGNDSMKNANIFMKLIELAHDSGNLIDAIGFDNINPSEEPILEEQFFVKHTIDSLFKIEKGS